jgi:hypothetical protein
MGLAATAGMLAAKGDTVSNSNNFVNQKASIMSSFFKKKIKLL